jgi:SAM-dependent methyltransferase
MQSILAHPTAYRAFRALIGAQRVHDVLVREQLRPQPKQRILDIGCGTGEMAAQLVDMDYLGIDAHEPCIRQARALYPSARFECSAIEDYQLDPGSFDLAVACGVLHHLNDRAALTLLRQARDCLRSGGRLVTLDGCFMPGQRAVVRWLLSRDRGRYVRSPESYQRLAAAVFPHVQTTIREDLLRIPYTHFIMSCSRD